MSPANAHLRARNVRSLALALAIAFLAAGLATGLKASPDDAATTYLVGVPDGSAAEVARAYGATLVADLPHLGIAVIKAGDALAQRIAEDARVSFVERDGGTRAESAHWDSASWSSASWNSASWNSASWDSASWNSASWNSASWNTASWSTASWQSAVASTASWNTAAWDSASWDTASWQTASWDTASWNTASWDTASWDGPGTWGMTPAPPWGLFAIQAPEAWTTGTPSHNIVVCIVDSGVDASHPALAPNLWHAADGSVGWNAITGTNDVTDEAGHGTAMAGIVAGTRGNGLGFAGVGAPLVQSVKVLANDGTGATSDVIKGIDWCVAHDANVMLLALSENAPTKAFKQAVMGASHAGLLVVASAGNNGPCGSCVSAPASYASVLAVDAIDPARHLANFSSQGPQLDILAPGVAITSAWPHASARVGSGTSQAAAFAAGAAAFLWGKDPSMNAEKVQEILKETALPFGKAGHDKESGAGVLDLNAAVQALDHHDNQ